MKATRILKMQEQDKLALALSILVPSITSLSPTSGHAAGGASVTVKGCNFASRDTVKFGGITAPTTV